MYLSFLRINIALESVEDTEYNFRALLMRRRQVQRGAAELYLSSYRINNAEESVVDYRVQLQRNVDEEGDKYTSLPSLSLSAIKFASSASLSSPCEKH